MLMAEGEGLCFVAIQALGVLRNELGIGQL